MHSVAGSFTFWIRLTDSYGLIGFNKSEPSVYIVGWLSSFFVRFRALSAYSRPDTHPQDPKRRAWEALAQTVTQTRRPLKPASSVEMPSPRPYLTLPSHPPAQRTRRPQASQDRSQYGVVVPILCPHPRSRLSAEMHPGMQVLTTPPGSRSLQTVRKFLSITSSRRDAVVSTCMPGSERAPVPLDQIVPRSEQQCRSLENPHRGGPSSRGVARTAPGGMIRASAHAISRRREA